MSTFKSFLGLMRDVLMVSLGKYGQYVVTLVTVPLCARLLGVEGTGMLAISTAAYFFGSIIVDWGLAQILAGRVGRDGDMGSTRRSYALLRASLMCLLLLILGTVLLVPASPVLLMIALGLVAGGISSLGEEWILLGKGQFARIAALQIVGRVFYLVTLVVLLPAVREPWLPIVLLGVSNFISAALSWFQARRVSFMNDGSVSISALLLSGRAPTLARLLGTAYGQGATVYFSLVVSIPALGLFSAAEKLARAAASALDAFGLALLPRMSRSRKAAEEFWTRAKKGAVAAFLLGSTAAAILWMAAPMAIGLLYGSDFQESVGVLRVMVLLLPAAATTSMISTSVFYVREDHKGILGGSLVGVALGVVAFVVTAISGGQIETLVICVVLIEWSVLLFNLLRACYLLKQDRNLAGIGPDLSEPDMNPQYRSSL